MKKVLSAILILCVLLGSFSACTTTNNGYKAGTITDNKYESAYLNLGFNLPEGHSFADEAARKDFENGMKKQMKEADEKTKGSAVLCEMISENEDKSERIIVTLEKKTDEQMATTKEVLQETTYNKLYAEYEKLYETYLMLDVPDTETNIGALFAHDVIATTDESETGYVVRRIITLDHASYYISITLAANTNERMSELTDQLYRLVEVNTEAAE
ncbi:MAG: hypothetical protein IJD83_07735 [Clostridia bacterium]|nr:hypothetical protein [Clostridia bacterium]